MILLRVLEKITCIKYKLKMRILYGNRFSYRSLRIRGMFHVFLEDGAKIEVGSVFFNRGCSLNAHKLISIGDNCIFGENVKIYDHNHVFSSIKIPFSQQGFTVQEVKIGNNCWIGSNVTILKGVTIGNNVVIGANCLIYKDIPDNSIVKLHSENIIERINCYEK